MRQVVFTAWCRHEQTAASLLKFGLGHVLQCNSFFLNFRALHLITLTQFKRGGAEICNSIFPLNISYTKKAYRPKKTYICKKY